MIFYPRSSILDLLSSIFYPRSSIFYPRDLSRPPLNQPLFDDLGVGVFGDLEEFERDFGLGDCLFAVAGLIEREAQVEKGVGLGLDVADLAGDVEGAGQYVGGGLVIARSDMGFAEVAERDGLAAAVAEFRGKTELFVEQFYRAADIAVEVFGDSQAAERAGFAAPVADLARDHQLLIEKFGGAFGVSHRVMRRAQPAEGLRFAPPIADLVRGFELLVEEDQGVAQVARREIGQPQIAERIGFATPVAGFARDLQGLFVTPHGVMDFGKVVVRIAERDQVTDGGVALVQFLRGRERGFAPANAFARALAQFQHVLARVRIVVAQLAGGVIVVDVGRRPDLPLLDVAPFQVDQSQPPPQRLSALFVERVGLVQHALVMRRKALAREGQLLIVRTGLGESRHQVMQAITPGGPIPFDQAVGHQTVERVVRPDRGDLPERRRGGDVEGVTEARQHSPELLQSGYEQVITQTQHGVYWMKWRM